MPGTMWAAQCMDPVAISVQWEDGPTSQLPPCQGECAETGQQGLPPQHLHSPHRFLQAVEADWKAPALVPFPLTCVRSLLSHAISQVRKRTTLREKWHCSAAQHELKKLAAIQTAPRDSAGNQRDEERGWQRSSAVIFLNMLNCVRKPSRNGHAALPPPLPVQGSLRKAQATAKMSFTLNETRVRRCIGKSRPMQAEHL